MKASWKQVGRARFRARALTVVVGLGVGSMAVIPLPANGSIVPIVSSVWTGFESGYAWGWSAKENVTIDADFAKTGVFGARVVNTLDQGGYLTWNRDRIVQGERYGRIAGWVKVVSHEPDENVGGFTLKNAAGSNHFDVWREATTGRWRYDLFRGDSAWSTMAAEVGEWTYFEVLVDFGGPGGTTYTAQVRINGVDQPTIESTGQEGTTVKAAWFGDPNHEGRTNTRYYDSLAVEVADTPFAFTP